MALLIVVGLGWLLAPFLFRPPGYLSIRLIDGAFGTLVPAEKATVRGTGRRNGATVPIRRATGGQFLDRLRLPSGEIELLIEVSGFRPASLRTVLQPLEALEQTVSLDPTFGRLELAVVNARARRERLTRSSALSVDGELWEPGLAPDGEVVLLLESGVHRVEAAADGFCTGSREISIEAGTTTRLTLPLSPAVGAAERARFVLDWGENPRDLDAHLLRHGEAIRAAERHVFFGRKRGFLADGEVFADLDVDWLESEGFETVTVYGPGAGSYSYLVHHYAGSGTLGTSAAEVVLFRDGCSEIRFEVPQGCSERWWHVADLVIADGETKVVERNRCGAPDGLAAADK